ncbi:MAG TPA: FkbM family methyltransferase [Trebonia sp.]|nr:FkbM family methyltransferase [Trebonia sp.]
MLRSRGINCVIDVGGNRGQTGQRLRALGYAGRIVSFEPSPTVLPAIRAAAERDPDWTVRPVALSSEAGQAELRLHQEPQTDSLADVLPGVADQIPGIAETGTATIELSTLAAELPQAVAGIAEPRVLVKSDTQGHDLEVLRGAGDKGLDETVAAVLVELVTQPIYRGQPVLTTVMDVLMADGFTPVAFEPLIESADGLLIVELDGLFLRAADNRPDWGMYRRPRYMAPPVPAAPGYGPSRPR